jgi:peptide/nickel transport system permease protein
MSRFLAVKLLSALLTIFLCTSISFFVLRLSGDPLDTMLSDDAPETIRQEYRERLDRPIAEQYARFVLTVFRGDFGVSLVDGRDAMSVVAERIPATLQLGGAVVVLALAIGIPAGVIAAMRRGRQVDRAITIGLSPLPRFAQPSRRGKAPGLPTRL